MATKAKAPAKAPRLADLAGAKSNSRAAVPDPITPALPGGFIVEVFNITEHGHQIILVETGRGQTLRADKHAVEILTHPKDGRHGRVRIQEGKFTYDP